MAAAAAAAAVMPLSAMPAAADTEATMTALVAYEAGRPLRGYEAPRRHHDGCAAARYDERAKRA